MKDVFVRAVHAGFTELRQVAILSLVCDNPGKSVRDYASALVVSKPSVTRAVDTLVKKGLLKSSPVMDDLRLIRIEPTTEGRRKMAQVMG